MKLRKYIAAATLIAFAAQSNLGIAKSNTVNTSEILKRELMVAVFENGYNNSFDEKLRDELLTGELFYTLREAQVLIERWRVEYNTIRPQSSLGYLPPVPEKDLALHIYIKKVI